MNCPECHQSNRMGVLICEHCGADLYEVLLERVPTRALSNFQTREFNNGTVSPSSNPLVAYVNGYEHPLAIQRRSGLIVGRGAPDEGIDLDLTPYGAQDCGVSRRHARFDAQSAQPTLSDLNSTNGVFINEARITANQAYIIKSGDELKLGRLLLRLYFK